MGGRLQAQPDDCRSQWVSPFCHFPLTRNGRIHRPSLIEAFLHSGLQMNHLVDGVMSSHLRPTLVRLHLLSSSLPSTSSSSTRAKASKEEKSKGKSSTICSLMQIMIVRKSPLEKRETAAAAVVSWISFHSGQLHRDGATLMASNQSKIQRQRQRQRQTQTQTQTQRRRYISFNQSIVQRIVSVHTCSSMK